MKTTLIGIAGGTASGKSTISKKVFAASEPYGSVVVINLDDYYKISDKPFAEREKINYDHPDTFDIELIVKHINDLKNGIAIKKPIYDFVNHIRSERYEIVNPSNVVIIEGILALAIPELEKVFDIKIFVDTPDDIRFIRRLKRDISKRGRTVESVINQYLETVRPMHLTFVEPSKKNANIIIPEGGNNTVAIDFITTKIVDLLNKS